MMSAKGQDVIASITGLQRKGAGTNILRPLKLISPFLLGVGRAPRVSVVWQAKMSAMVGMRAQRPVVAVPTSSLTTAALGSMPIRAATLLMGLKKVHRGF